MHAEEDDETPAWSSTRTVRGVRRREGRWAYAFQQGAAVCGRTGRATHATSQGPAPRSLMLPRARSPQTCVHGSRHRQRDSYHADGNRTSLDILPLGRAQVVRLVPSCNLVPTGPHEKQDWRWAP